MAEEAQRALSQCDQVVIHDVQMQALQVRNFARNMDGKNLPLPARSRLGTDAKTLGDKAALGRTLSVSHDRLVGTIMLDGYRKRTDRLDILFVDTGYRTQAPYQGRRHEAAVHRPGCSD
jgi:hypothetical protein